MGDSPTASAGAGFLVESRPVPSSWGGSGGSIRAYCSANGNVLVSLGQIAAEFQIATNAEGLEAIVAVCREALEHARETS